MMSYRGLLDRCLVIRTTAIITAARITYSYVTYYWLPAAYIFSQVNNYSHRKPRLVNRLGNIIFSIILSTHTRWWW